MDSTFIAAPTAPGPGAAPEDVAQVPPTARIRAEADLPNLVPKDT